MSETYLNIKSEWMKARKEKSHLAPFIGTLVSDCNSHAKAAKTASPSEADVLRVLKKHLKGLEETLKVNPKATEILHQKNFVTRFLPQTMSEEELRDKLRGLKFDNIGAVMGYLKSNYGPKVDMKMASGIAKDFVK